MANLDVRDDMPIADFTAHSSRGFGPGEAPRKQKCYKLLAFSEQGTANVGDPRLVVPICQ